MSSKSNNKVLLSCEDRLETVSRIARRGLSSYIDNGETVKTGSSPTVGYIIEMGGQKFFAKVSAHYDPGERRKKEACFRNEGILYERLVYEQCLTKAYAMSPCLVRYVTSITIPGEAVPKTQSKLLKKIGRMTQKCVTNVTELDVTLTEFVHNSMTLYDFLRVADKKSTGATSNMDFAPVVAQVVGTLAVIEKMGIQHNDLHLGNVLCSVQGRRRTRKSPTPGSNSHRSIAIQLGSKKSIRILETWLHIFIFDWDFAFVKGHAPNPRVTDFAGECSFVNSNKRINAVLDLYTFLQDMNRVISPNAELMAFTNDVFPDFVNNQKVISGELGGLSGHGGCSGHIPASLKHKHIAPNIQKHGIVEVLKLPYLRPYVKFMDKI